MAFTVIYDACVLYPAPLRDLLMRLALTDLFRARWSETILDECFRNVLRGRPDIGAARLTRTRDLMNQALPDACVCGHERLIAGLELPDVDDRHVLAAAIQAHAQVIVTFNLKDFPADALAPHGVEAQHPDEFLLHLIDLAPGAVWATVVRQAQRLRNPPQSVAELLDTLRRQKLGRSVARLQELFGEPG